MTMDGRRPLVEDNPGWKMTSDGRWHLNRLHPLKMTLDKKWDILFVVDVAVVVVVVLNVAIVALIDVANNKVFNCAQ